MTEAVYAEAKVQIDEKCSEFTDALSNIKNSLQRSEQINGELAAQNGASKEDMQKLRELNARMLQRGKVLDPCKDAEAFEAKIRMLQEEVTMLRDIVESYGEQETDTSEDYDGGVDEFANPHAQSDDELASKIPSTFHLKCLVQSCNRTMSTGCAGPANCEQVNCEMCGLDLAAPVGKYGSKSFRCTSHGSFCMACSYNLFYSFSEQKTDAG